MTCLYKAKYGLSYTVYATFSSCGFLDCDMGGTGGHLFKNQFRADFIMPPKYKISTVCTKWPVSRIHSTFWTFLQIAKWLTKSSLTVLLFPTFGSQSRNEVIMNPSQAKNYANKGSLPFHAILSPMRRICLAVLANLPRGDKMGKQTDHLCLAWQIAIIPGSTQIVRYWK